MEGQGTGHYGAATRHLDDGPHEDGGYAVAHPEADHHEADVADSPAAGDEGLKEKQRTCQKKWMKNVKICRLVLK